MIKKINFVQLKIIANSKQLVLNPINGKRLVVPGQVSSRPNTIGTFVKRNNYKYSKGESHD